MGGKKPYASIDDPSGKFHVDFFVREHQGADERVLDADVLTLYAHQLLHQTVTDEQLDGLRECAHKVAPDYVATLYARQQGLRDDILSLHTTIERIWVRQRRLIGRVRRLEALHEIDTPDGELCIIPE